MLQFPFTSRFLCGLCLFHGVRLAGLHFCDGLGGCFGPGAAAGALGVVPVAVVAPGLVLRLPHRAPALQPLDLPQELALLLFGLGGLPKRTR